MGATTHVIHHTYVCIIGYESHQGILWVYASTVDHTPTESGDCVSRCGRTFRFSLSEALPVS